MGDISWFEQLRIQIFAKIKCFFGYHDGDVYGVLYASEKEGDENGTFYVTCCGWCGSIKYGADV